MNLSIIIHWFLLISLGYLIITSFILIRNRFELTNISDEPDPESSDGGQIPKISVCIPARNEENNIGNLLESLAAQDYGHYEIIVLDDCSDDRTHEIVENFIRQNPNLCRIVKGLEKPENWLGKPWACQQLGKMADGEILLFLDADTILRPNNLKKIVAALNNHQIQMLTVWPQQITITFWEKVIIPLVYYALVTLLPAIYVYRKPRWMPELIHNHFKSVLAASCGQCIAIQKETWLHINGHESVKNKIVEDVEIAREVKRQGFKLRMFTGIGSIYCRMYRTENEIFEGFRKNFLPGFRDSVLLFILSALMHIIVFVIPFIALIYSVLIIHPALFFLSAASVIFILLHRLILSVWFRWDPIYTFTHPLGVLWFQRLGIRSLIDKFTGIPKIWKGRPI